MCVTHRATFPKEIYFIGWNEIGKKSHDKKSIIQHTFVLQKCTCTFVLPKLFEHTFVHWMHITAPNVYTLICSQHVKQTCFPPNVWKHTYP